MAQKKASRIAPQGRGTSKSELFNVHLLLGAGIQLDSDYIASVSSDIKPRPSSRVPLSELNSFPDVASKLALK